MQSHKIKTLSSDFYIKFYFPLWAGSFLPKPSTKLTIVPYVVSAQAVDIRDSGYETRYDMRLDLRKTFTLNRPSIFMTKLRVLK
jgi:hypothetical protein